LFFENGDEKKIEKFFRNLLHGLMFCDIILGIEKSNGS
jgi:hypothetical protein